MGKEVGSILLCEYPTGCLVDTLHQQQKDLNDPGASEYEQQKAKVTIKVTACDLCQHPALLKAQSG